MYNGQDSQYRKSYDFVPFGKRETYIADGKEAYTGYIDLNIICISDLHIGSGYSDFVGTGKELVSETIKLHGKPIIPGATFKGAVRAIAAAASNSCNPNRKGKDSKPTVGNKDASSNSYDLNRKCSSNEHCIVCDMFGTMGLASNVIFPDFCSENAEIKIRTLNSQFPPQNKKDSHYKFYRTGENNYEGSKKVKAEVVAYDAEFSGRIFFKKLTEEELSLLMFSMGLNSKALLNLKIGGFKNEGMGEVYTEVVGFKADGLNKDPAELAEQYVNMRSANKSAIDKINDILCSR